MKPRIHDDAAYYQQNQILNQKDTARPGFSYAASWGVRAQDGISAHLSHNDASMLATPAMFLQRLTAASSTYGASEGCATGQ